ncbi:MAG TPA: hypothetical protein DC049_14840, partial [Spirochaetia bacterium]|nr:hypothetical protein [Spirochaetia bacterium]
MKKQTARTGKPGQKPPGKKKNNKAICSSAKSSDEITLNSGKLKQILDSLVYPLYVINAENYIVEFANQAAGKFKKNRTTCYQLSHGRNSPCLRQDHPCPLEMVKSTGKMARTEHIHKISGRTRIMAVHGHPIFGKNGKVDKIIEYAIDITDRRSAEHLLQTEKNKLQAVMNACPVALLVIDENNKILYVNQAAGNFSGVSTDVLRGKKCGDVLLCRNRLLGEKGCGTSPLCPDCGIYSAIKSGLENRSEPGTSGEQILGVAGCSESLWVRFRTAPMEISGKPCVIISLDNINEQKKLELYQKKSIKRIQSLIKILQYDSSSLQDFLDFSLQEIIEITSSKIGYIYLYDENTRQLRLNSWSREVMKECRVLNPQTCYELSQTGIWGEVVRQRRPVIINNFSEYHPLKKGYPDGHVHLDRFMSIPVMVNNRIAAVAAVANRNEDYTDRDCEQFTMLMDAVWKEVERKKIGEDLFRSREQFALAVKGTHDGIWDWDLKNNKLYLSARWKEMLGYRDDELENSFETFSSRLHPEDAPRVMRHIDQYLKNESPEYSIEFRFRHKNGSYIWILARGEALRDEKGMPYRMAGSHTDITERKQHEEKIFLELEQKKRSLLEAGEIQRSLLPGTLPVLAELNIAAWYMPSQELGGDFFDLRHNENFVAVITADCTGHGIEASLHATLLKAITDRHVQVLLDGHADEFLNLVNQDVISYFHTEGDFPVMFAGVLERSTGIFSYANANFEMPVLFPQGQTIEKPEGFHLGYARDTVYKCQKLKIPENSTLAIFSDAIIEIDSGETRVFSRSHLLETLRGFSGSAQQNLEKLRTRIRGISTFPLKDDVTVILLEYLPAVKSEIIIHNKSQIENATAQLSEKMFACGYEPNAVSAAAISTEECLLNALVHGNHEDPQKKVIIEFYIDCGKTIIRITDEGRGFNPQEIPDPAKPGYLKTLLDTDEEQKYTHGRGIWLIKKYMNFVEYNQTGNSVRMIKIRPAAGPLYESLPKDEPEEKPEYSGEPPAVCFDYQTVLKTGLSIPAGYLLNSREFGILIHLGRRAYNENLRIAVRVE